MASAELELMEARSKIRDQQQHIQRLMDSVDLLNKEKTLLPPTLLMLNKHMKCTCGGPKGEGFGFDDSLDLLLNNRLKEFCTKLEDSMGANIRWQVMNYEGAQNAINELSGSVAEMRRVQQSGETAQSEQLGRITDTLTALIQSNGLTLAQTRELQQLINEKMRAPGPMIEVPQRQPTPKSPPVRSISTTKSEEIDLKAVLSPRSSAESPRKPPSRPTSKAAKRSLSDFSDVSSDDSDARRGRGSFARIRPKPPPKKAAPKMTSPTSFFDNFQIADREVRLYEKEGDPPIVVMRAGETIGKFDDLTRTFTLTRIVSHQAARYPLHHTILRIQTEKSATNSNFDSMIHKSMRRRRLR